MAVEALTRGIINKVMHTPITTLKTAAKESEATTVVDVVRRLFNLNDKEAASSQKRRTKWRRARDGYASHRRRAASSMLTLSERCQNERMPDVSFVKCYF